MCFSIFATTSTCSDRHRSSALRVLFVQFRGQKPGGVGGYTEVLYIIFIFDDGRFRLRMLILGEKEREREREREMRERDR